VIIIDSSWFRAFRKRPDFFPVHGAMGSVGSREPSAGKNRAGFLHIS
jgi:hypothetical protein